MVAAGVLAYGVHDLQEAGILPGLNNLAFDVSNAIPPDSWLGTLLKGTLNFSPQTTWLEAVAWVLYVVPTMTLFFRVTTAAAPSAPAPRRCPPAPPPDRSPAPAKDTSPVKHPRLVAALVAAAGLPALAACTSNSTHRATATARGRAPGPISVTSSDDACDAVRRQGTGRATSSSR